MRYLIVGLGNIGKKRQHVLGDRCVATVDLYQEEATYQSYLEVPLNNFDAVVLATPNHVKIEYLTYFLRVGKHVLVEKPLIFPDEQTALQLRTLAERSGVIWYTSYNHRFEPHIIRIQQLLNEGKIGAVYHAHLIYGNGTVQNCIGTWRESGYGVLEDLGCHLIDLAEFLFHYSTPDYVVWDCQCVESKAFDYCIFSTLDRKVFFECGTIIWKNTFTIDVYGQLGSLHMSGLCKWGPSELIVRERVFPSGVPNEQRFLEEGPDPTWGADIAHFERAVSEGATTLQRDWQMSIVIRRLAGSATPNRLRTTTSNRLACGTEQ